jgi:hypothetical protein
MMTLPSDRGTPTVENLRYFHKRRRVFFQWMQRQPWGLVKAAWVRETSPASEEGEKREGNRLHFHLLVAMRSRFLPYGEKGRAGWNRSINGTAERVGLGYVHFEPIWRADGAARYVGKLASYVVKEAALDDPLAGERLFGLPNHTLDPKPKDPEWCITWVHPQIPYLVERCDPATGEVYVVPSG